MEFDCGIAVGMRDVSGIVAVVSGWLGALPSTADKVGAAFSGRLGAKAASSLRMAYRGMNAPAPFGAFGVGSAGFRLLARFDAAFRGRGLVLRFARKFPSGDQVCARELAPDRRHGNPHLDRLISIAPTGLWVFIPCRSQDSVFAVGKDSILG